MDNIIKDTWRLQNDDIHTTVFWQLCDEERVVTQILIMVRQVIFNNKN